VHAIGAREAAWQVSERVYSKGVACNVWILPCGGIIVRRLDADYQAPPDECLVGVYNRKHCTADIEADIQQHVGEMRSARKVKSEPTHALYWPTDTRTRVRALRNDGRSVASISRTLGVPFGTVRRWVYESQEQAA